MAACLAVVISSFQFCYQAFYFITTESPKTNFSLHVDVKYLKSFHSETNGLRFLEEFNPVTKGD